MDSTQIDTHSLPDKDADKFLDRVDVITNAISAYLKEDPIEAERRRLVREERRINQVILRKEEQVRQRYSLDYHSRFGDTNMLDRLLDEVEITDDINPLQKLLNKFQGSECFSSDPDEVIERLSLEEALRIFKEAEKHRNEKNFENALKRYEEVLQLVSEKEVTKFIRLIRLEIFYDRKMFKELFSESNIVLENFPNEEIGYFYRAVSFLEFQKPQEAISDLYKLNKEKYSTSTIKQLWDDALLLKVDEEEAKFFEDNYSSEKSSLVKFKSGWIPIIDMIKKNDKPEPTALTAIANEFFNQCNDPIQYMYLRGAPAFICFKNGFQDLLTVFHFFTYFLQVTEYSNQLAYRGIFVTLECLSLIFNQSYIGKRCLSRQETTFWKNFRTLSELVSEILHSHTMSSPILLLLLEVANGLSEIDRIEIATILLPLINFENLFTLYSSPILCLIFQLLTSLLQDKTVGKTMSQWLKASSVLKQIFSQDIASSSFAENALNLILQFFSSELFSSEIAPEVFDFDFYPILTQKLCVSDKKKPFLLKGYYAILYNWILKSKKKEEIAEKLHSVNGFEKALALLPVENDVDSIFKDEKGALPFAIGVLSLLASDSCVVKLVLSREDDIWHSLEYCASFLDSESPDQLTNFENANLDNSYLLFIEYSVHLLAKIYQRNNALRANLKNMSIAKTLMSIIRNTENILSCGNAALLLSFSPLSNFEEYELQSLDIISVLLSSLRMIESKKFQHSKNNGTDAFSKYSKKSVLLAQKNIAITLACCAKKPSLLAELRAKKGIETLHAILQETSNM